MLFLIFQRGPPSPSSPKQIRYDRLLEQPGAYPTLPRKEDAPQPVNTPGIYATLLHALL